MKKKRITNGKTLVSHSRLILAAIDAGKPELARRIFENCEHHKALSQAALEACLALYLESGEAEHALEIAKILDCKLTDRQLGVLVASAQKAGELASFVMAVKQMTPGKKRDRLIRKMVSQTEKGLWSDSVESLIGLTGFMIDEKEIVKLLEAAAEAFLGLGYLHDWEAIVKHLKRLPNSTELDVIERSNCRLGLEFLKWLPDDSSRFRMIERFASLALERGEIGLANQAARINGVTLNREQIRGAIATVVNHGNLDTAQAAAKEFLDRDLNDDELTAVFCSRIRNRWSGYGRLLTGEADQTPHWRLRLARSLAAAVTRFDVNQIRDVIGEVVFNDKVPAVFKQIVGEACLMAVLREGDDGFGFAENIAVALGRKLQKHEIDLAIVAEAVKPGCSTTSVLQLAEKHRRQLSPEVEAIILSSE